MKQAFESHIYENFNLHDSKIVVAISGGVDSIVLAHLFVELDFNIILAHCNFQLRDEESDEDEQFVIDFGKKLGVKTLIKRFDTLEFSSESKMNIQLAARNLRYDWFKEISKENECDYIATAHHSDDNIETFFINLSRGAGINGLLGIPFQNGKIIRPLLPFTKKMIINYATSNNLQWREDSSNQIDKYVRNRIRNHISPTLSKIHPNFLENFKKTQHYLAQSTEFIDKNIKKIKEKYFKKEKNIIYIDKNVINEDYDIDFLFHHLFYPYNFKNIDDLKKLMVSTESGKKVFSSTHQLINNKNQLILQTRNNENNNQKNISLVIQKEELSDENITKFEFFDKNNNISATFSFEIHKINNFSDFVRIRNKNNDASNNNNDIYIDFDTVKFPITIRYKKEGDFFYPFGANYKKTISKFFIDEKYNHFQKEQQLLLCSEEEIIWIVEKRLDNRFRITDKTKNILIVKKY